MRSVAVTGTGIVSPVGSDPAAFAAAIRGGRCPIRPLPDARVPGGQHAVGAPADDAPPGPGRARAMVTAAAAAALQGSDGDEGGTGLVLGTSLGDIETALDEHLRFVRGEAPDHRRFLDAQPDGLTEAVARELGLGGPRLTLSCACTSGASGLGLALDRIRSGGLGRVVVAAVDTLNDFVLCGFSSLWALTSDLPRPFDTARTGMALGECAVAFLVEDVDEARRRGARIHAIVEGYGASGDAVHITAPDRSGTGAARALADALKDAAWLPASVDYLNVHATGSLYNDAMILRAIHTVFTDRATDIPVSSVNPATGHTLGSAGLAEALATILALEKGFVPPTANLQAPEEPEMKLVRGEALPTPLRRALSLTTGFGGANTALALSLPDGGGRP